MCCIMPLAGMTRAQTLERAPLNPEFQQFQEQYQEGTLSMRTADGHGLGYIPPPYKLPAPAAEWTESRELPRALPASYDLRNYNKLTPVKDQGSEGNCWAFATYSSMESCLLTGETWDFSENNLANLHGYTNRPYGTGGNAFMSLAYLSRWSGPVNEADDPYSNGADGSPTGLSVRKHVQRAQFIPDRTSSTDNDAIKQAIMTYGALYSTFCWIDGPSYWNDTTGAFYNDTAVNANHAIAIIGWDDNYSRNNFNSTPPGDGAFLIKNSWGPSWGNAGCLWISYYDAKIGKDNVMFHGVESTSNYASVYQYDTLGFHGGYGYGGTTAWGANIFTKASGTIQAVSFYALAAGTSYEIRIYTGGSAGNPISGTLSATQSGTVNYAGYYTVTLNSPVSFATRFSVVVKWTTPGSSETIPAEDWRGAGSTAAVGESYISPDGISWHEAKNPYTDLPFNVCIKAFGTGGSGPPPPPPPPPVTAGWPLLTDYDGDGRADPAIYRADGSFRLLLSSRGYGYYRFNSIYGGQCVPQPGDFDGDRYADPAVLDPTTSYWRFYSSRRGYDRYYINLKWYKAGATPIIGDFDGDGKADPTYVEPSGAWYVLSSGLNYASYYSMQWGNSSYTPTCGDIDGDGRADPMLYHEPSGYWFFLLSRYDYNQTYMWFGGPGYVPVPGDFDGDRLAELAVYHSASGTWYILLSGSGYQQYIYATWDGSAL
ncbi:MAG: lectin like domain-containing protein [Kiritimatiellia bacterium]